MFRPEETGGLGLTDTTAEHVMQAVGLALPRREPYFRRSRISQKPRAMQMNLHWHVSSGGDGRPWTHGYNGGTCNASRRACIAEA